MLRFRSIRPCHPVPCGYTLSGGSSLPLTKRKRSAIMNEVEKYLAALEAAVEVKDKEVILLLEPFATHLYKDIHTRAGKASDEDRAAWEEMLRRIKYVIAGMATASPELW